MLSLSDIEFRVIQIEKQRLGAVFYWLFFMTVVYDCCL